jgi:hypothetical protein
MVHKSIALEVNLLQESKFNFQRCLNVEEKNNLLRHGYEVSIDRCLKFVLKMRVRQESVKISSSTRSFPQSSDHKRPRSSAL